MGSIMEVVEPGEHVLAYRNGLQYNITFLQRICKENMQNQLMAISSPYNRPRKPRGGVEV
jgi:hypothetical protein